MSLTLSQSMIPPLAGRVPLLERKERRSGKQPLYTYFGPYGR